MSRIFEFAKKVIQQGMTDTKDGTILRNFRNAMRPDSPGRLMASQFARTVVTEYQHFRDGSSILDRFRERMKSGTRERSKPLHVGPNEVFVHINRSDGTVQDLGVSRNLLTNIGRDVWCGSWGFRPAGQTLAAQISTAISATTIQDTGSVYTASNLATPQLGVAGMRVYASPNTTTNPLVWGNIISNTTHIITVDQWWKYAAVAGGPPTNPDIVGTTPTSGNSYLVAPGGLGAIQFMGLTANASAASASNTVLTGEITTNGGARQSTTYAHTFGGTTLTLTSIFNFSGTLTAVHRGGLFTTLEATPGTAPMVYETVFSSPGDFTVGNGDSATCTWTITPSG